jgi:hypothetical protein
MRAMGSVQKRGRGPVCARGRGSARTAEGRGVALLELDLAYGQLARRVWRRLGRVRAASGVRVLPKGPAIETDEPELHGGHVRHVGEQDATVLAKPAHVRGAAKLGRGTWTTQ